MSGAAFQATHRGRKVFAFTLIELLVVVSIIALLISILLPSLAQVREKSRLAKCLSNLHQIGTTMQQYFGEYADTFPWWDRRILDDCCFFSLGWSWYYGGRYPPIDVYGEPHFAYHDWLRYYPEERPFNRYLYPDARGPKAETKLYLCPSDRGMVN